jgi:hypothetical protein
VGGLFHQAICPLRKELLLDGCLGVEPRRALIAMTEGDSAKVLVDGIRVGWTGQSPDRTTEKGEKNDGSQSMRTNGRREISA